MSLKRIIIVIATSTSFAVAGVLEDYSEQVGSYIGMCYGLNHLQKNYCSNIQRINPSDCIQNSLNLLPDRYRIEFYKAILDSQDKLKNNAENSVKKGFNKTLLIAENDKEKACVSYSSSAMTMTYMKYEEMKKSATRIQ